jgi:hypothetical protein
VHLQGADLPATRLFVLRVLDVAGEFARPLDPQRSSTGAPTLIRAQTSGPCVHIDQAVLDDLDAVQALGLACRHPDGSCPHLDHPEILCPVKDACYAMAEVGRLREVCEAEQEEQDRAMAAEAVPQSDYVLAPPEAPAAADPEPLSPDAGDPVPVVPAPESCGEDSYTSRVILVPPPAKRKDAWSEDELWVVARVPTAPEAIKAYRAAYPDTARTDGAIKAQWRKLRGPDQEKAPEAPPAPTPDFAGDQVPVTQCETKGFYGDARALHADMMDGMMCDRPLSRSPGEKTASREEEKTLHPWVGMQVRILGPSDLANKTGKVVEYSLDPREMLVALDGSLDRVWLPPESLLLIGVGRAQA